MIANHPAATALAAAALAVDGAGDLRAVLETVGLIAPPARAAQRRVGSRNLRPLSPVPSVARPAGAPHGLCPLPLCHNPAPAPGVPCRGCAAALGPYLREIPACREGIGEAA